MKSLAPHDRPREKLARLGSGVLGDNELLAVVLGHGFRRDSALEIANRVLGLSDGVQGLTRVRPSGSCTRWTASGRRRLPKCWLPSSWDGGGAWRRGPGTVSQPSVG